MNALDVIKIRTNLNLTQAEFGKLIGVNKRTIINYEQGKSLPSSKAKLLELMLANGIGNTPVEKVDKNEIEDNKIEPISEDFTESLLKEIVSLKDHILTLKEFLNEKTKVSELYAMENKMLKDKIESMINDKNKEQ